MMFRLFPAIALICIAGFFLLAAGCTVLTGDETGSRNGQFTPGIAYPARVIRIIDGDTIRVMFPDGNQDTIRLLGIDTPELSYDRNDTGFFDGVSDPLFLMSWAGEAATALREVVDGQEVRFTTDRAAGERDRYGRILAYLSSSDGTDIGGMLVSRGLARVYTPESFARKQEYLDLQHEAMQKRIGIWGGTAPAPPGSGGVFLAAVHYDAAGDDRFNLNDEYIIIGNSGSTTVDLTLWQIRDGRAVAFVFPEMSLSPGDQVTVRTGSGSPGQQELFVGSDFPILNNDAGTVALHDREGTERSRFSWG